MADFVPEDVVNEILVRLPVKSILRFELVCKRWKSRSRSPSFSEFYRVKREKKSSDSNIVHVMNLKDLYNMASQLWNHETVTKKMKKAWRYVDRPLHRPLHRPPYRDVDWKSEKTIKNRKITAIGPSSNGIYCLTSVSKEFYTGCEEAGSVRIALCNPSIRRFRFLPSFPKKFRHQLAEISSKGDSRVFSGFGSGGSGYSVVVGINYKLESASRNCFLVFLYTSKRGWEIIEGALSKIMEIYRTLVCTQSFLHGCWHWMARGETSFKVLSFNFAQQSFDVINVPSVLEYGPRVRVEVVVLQGHLALISWCEAGNGYLKIDVWMMMDYGVEKPWTKIFCILTSYYSNFSSSSVLYGIDYVEDRSERGGIRIERLFFTKKGDHTLFIYCDRDGRIGASNIKSHSFEHDVSFSTRGISVYTESLDRP